MSYIELTLSSQSRGRWSKISRGSVSAAITMNSAMPRFKHLVAARKYNVHTIKYLYYNSKIIDQLSTLYHKKKNVVSSQTRNNPN